MTEPPKDPVRPADEEARVLARDLLNAAHFAALATLTDQGAPFVTRIALATDPQGRPLTLVSRLSAHTAPLLRGAEVSLLIGEPGDKGDPLTHPRLTLQAIPQPVLREDPAYAPLAAHYAQLRPKARLYMDFADFLLVRFAPRDSFLNGGFGKAFRMTPADLLPPPETQRPDP